MALVFDYSSAWAWQVQPQGRDFDYFRLMLETYRGLRRNALNIDIVPPDVTDLSAYAMVVVPGLFAWNDNLKAALATCRGRVVLGPRTGSKTRDFAIPESLPPDFPPLGITVTRVESLRPDTPVKLEKGGAFRIWIEDCTGGEVIEYTSDGRPAVLASDTYRYLAGWPDPAAMIRILGTIAAEAGLPTIRLPEGVRIRDTEAERFVFNYGLEAAPASTVPGLDAPVPSASLVRMTRP